MKAELEGAQGTVGAPRGLLTWVEVVLGRLLGDGTPELSHKGE